MRAHFNLPSVEAEEQEGKPPIAVKFEIPYFTTSGIQVRYLKIIEKSGYQALPWVRYITQNGDYQIRVQWVLKDFTTAALPRTMTYIYVCVCELQYIYDCCTDINVVHFIKGRKWGQGWIVEETGQPVRKTIIIIKLIKIKSVVNA